MKKKEDSGFTLIELMISVSINGLMAVSLFTFFQFQTKMFEKQNQVSQLQQNLHAALHNISSAVINAGYDPLGIGFDAIDRSSNESFIKIYADLNENGKIPPSDQSDKINEMIVFRFDKKRQVIKNWLGQSIIDNIIEMQIQYDYPPPTTQLVTISLTARTEKEEKGFIDGYNLQGTRADGTCRTIRLQADIMLRNGQLLKVQ